MYRDTVPIVKEKRSLAVIVATPSRLHGGPFSLFERHRRRTGKSRARIEARHAIGREAQDCRNR